MKIVGTKLISRVCQALVQPEVGYAVIATIFTIALCIVVPPAFGHDETEHYFRVHQLSSGQLFATDAEFNQLVNTVGEPDQPITGAFLGGDVPADIYNLMANNFAHAYDDVKYQFPPTAVPENPPTSSNPSEFVNVAFTNTSIYSPLAYMPYLIGHAVAQVAANDTYLVFLFTRIIAALLLVALYCCIIRLVPVGKWFFFVIGLFPSVISTFATISSDPMNIIVVFTLITLTMRLCYLDKNSLKSSEYPIFVVTVIALGMIKYTLLPFLLFIGLVPICNRVYRNRHDIIKLFVPCFLSIITFLIWFTSTHNADIRGYYFSESGSIQAQLSHIFNQPLSVLELLFNTVLFGENNVFSTVIIDSPYKNIAVPAVYTFIVVALLVVALRTPALGEVIITSFSRPIKWFARILLMLQLFGTYAILYLSFTPVGQSGIWGVQGRYFIVCIPLLLLIFYTRKRTELQYFPPLILKQRTSATIAFKMYVGSLIPLIAYLSMSIGHIY
jgi:uncharacterized membrane protein